MVTKSGSVSGSKLGVNVRGSMSGGGGHGQGDEGQGLGSWGQMVGWVYCGGRL